MRVAVISDIHIGPPGKADIFGHSDRSFCGFLRNLEISFDKIVLCGDIIETLTPKYPGQYEQAFWQAWSYHREVTSRFEKDIYIYVYGNHDFIAKKTVGAKERVNIHGATFLHGHQTDALVTYPIGEVIVYLAGWAMRAGFKSLYEKASQVESIRHLRKSSAFYSKVQELANDSILVMGHTHSAKVQKIGDVLYMNSGYCAFGNQIGCSLDFESSEFKLLF
jgi:UDP-2,3-diacylglucosamine pyrophosphatase LpxH